MVAKLNTRESQPLFGWSQNAFSESEGAFPDVTVRIDVTLQ